MENRQLTPEGVRGEVKRRCVGRVISSTQRGGLKRFTGASTFAVFAMLSNFGGWIVA